MAPRCVAGIPWDGEAKRLPQAVIRLRREEAWALHGTGRLQRLQAGAPAGVHLQLLDAVTRSEVNGQPCLIITGISEDGVLRARNAATTLLGKEDGLGISVHPHDVQELRLRGCKLLAEVEHASGCRITVDDTPKAVVETMHRSCRQHTVRLFGEQAEQARALDLLAKACRHPVRIEEERINVAHPARSCTFQAFDPVARGRNVELLEGGAVVRRARATDGVSSPSDCIVVSNGVLGMQKPGAFFSVRVRKACYDRGHRGGTRIGITTLPVDLPLPDTLLKRPELCWVLGRGLLRGPDKFVFSVPAANFDNLSEGDLLGVLVTSAEGSLAVFHQARGETDWHCLVHWAAGIPTPHSCYALLELGGRLSEVEVVTNLKAGNVPQALVRSQDFPVLSRGRVVAAAAEDTEAMAAEAVDLSSAHAPVAEEN